MLRTAIVVLGCGRRRRRKTQLVSKHPFFSIFRYPYSSSPATFARDTHNSETNGPENGFTSDEEEEGDNVPLAKGIFYGSSGQGSYKQGDATFHRLIEEMASSASFQDKKHVTTMASCFIKVQTWSSL